MKNEKPPVESFEQDTKSLIEGKNFTKEQLQELIAMSEEKARGEKDKNKKEQWNELIKTLRELLPDSGRSKEYSSGESPKGPGESSTGGRSRKYSSGESSSKSSGES